MKKRSFMYIITFLIIFFLSVLLCTPLLDIIANKFLNEEQTNLLNNILYNYGVFYKSPWLILIFISGLFSIFFALLFIKGKKVKKLPPTIVEQKITTIHYHKNDVSPNMVFIKNTKGGADNEK